MELNNQKTVQGWYFFDWANSAYALVITATIFPAYYNTVTKEAFQGEIVSFLGFPINNTVLYSYALSFSFLIITVLSPFLSGIADYGGRKKPFMRFFTTLGSFACMSLFFFTGENIELGIIGTILASVGFTGSMVFYNAFLLEIVTPDRYDEVSAKGFTYGYVGSVILLIVNLLMVQHPDWFMLPNAGFAARLSFLMVGIWWLLFSQITFQR
ncbi:MAG: MFS transporter, partial [Bacteroidia bacterium]